MLVLPVYHSIKIGRQPEKFHIEFLITEVNQLLDLSEDGSGKVIWFDIAPGLLYSLTMDNNASEEALLPLAEQIYTPVQGG